MKPLAEAVHWHNVARDNFEVRADGGIEAAPATRFHPLAGVRPNSDTA